MSKFKEITREEKLQKMVKSQNHFALGQSTIEKRVPNNSHHLFILCFGGTLSLLIFAKISIKKCSKRFHYELQVQSPKNLPRKLPRYIAKIP
jgi:hypothetical protein